jgi:hypothetical protein
MTRRFPVPVLNSCDYRLKSVPLEWWPIPHLTDSTHMKIQYKCLVTAALVALSTATLHAQTNTVLEGFEGFTDLVPGSYVWSPSSGAYVELWTMWGGRSASGQVTVGVYTATSPGDPRVTEGTNSIAVTFLADGFGNDLGIALDDLATAAIENAATSNQLARYILRYDVIFEHADQYVYFNQHALFCNDWNYVNLGGAVYKTNNGVVYAVVSYSSALELPTTAVPSSGHLGWWGGSWIITDQFGTRQPVFTNCTIYLDNVRLVDTYAPGASPVVYPLQSFENPANPLGGASSLYPTVTSFFGNVTTNRATLTSFLTNGLYNPSNSNGVAGIYTTNKGPIDGDFAVTDGTHALQVSNRWRDNINFQFDFALPFAGTKLAEVLAASHSPADLAHYTLRWDTTMPAVWSAASDGDYINMVFCTGSSYLPMAQGRRQSLGQNGLQRATYSVTLDQITAWGGSPTGGDPALIFAFNGASEGIPYIYYFDNFELIDTAPPPPTITSWQYNSANRHFTLTWTSVPGATYSVLTSPTLAAGSFTTTLASGIASGGSQTTTTVTMPGGNTGFLRVEQ